LKRLMTVACAGALASFALIGATGAGAADDHSRSAQAKQCAAMKKADKAAFKATFGPKHAMRHCIKGEPVDPTVSEFKNAAKECKAEREADADAFRATYGSNENGRNALGKCVSSHVKHTEEDGDDGGEEEVVA
jgi:hypothetical protein